MSHVGPDRPVISHPRLLGMTRGQKLAGLDRSAGHRPPLSDPTRHTSRQADTHKTVVRQKQQHREITPYTTSNRRQQRFTERSLPGGRGETSCGLIEEMSTELVCSPGSYGVWSHIGISAIVIWVNLLQSRTLLPIARISFHEGSS